MKIVYLIHQFVPEHYRGTEKFVLNLAKQMKVLGHEIKVITMSFYEETFYDQSFNEILYREFSYKEVEIIALKRPERDWKQLTSEKDLRELAKELLIKEAPDLVHVSHTIRVAEFVEAIQELNIPYILTMTDFYLMCPYAILKKPNGDLCYGDRKSVV